MRILFDQGTPAPLRRHLSEHQVDTVYERGWSQMENGALLDAAENEKYELLVTTDQNLRFQEDLNRRRIAVIVRRSTAWPRIRNCIDEIRAAIDEFAPGECREIAIP